jgi:dolichol-phosphate mannosyltransferase
LKQGTAKAYVEGFKWGLERNYDIFLQFDGDFSHDPKYIPGMLEAIKTCDVVIGSRYVRGGGVVDWPLKRRILSRGGSIYSRFVLSCPIRDFTGGYNMWKRPVLEKIGLDGIISKSFSLQVELKYRAYRAGFSIKEVPILFADRKEGVSKISGGTVWEALGIMWKIKKYVGMDTGVDQFFKFAVTGGLGTVTNLLIFFLLVDVANLNQVLISVCCFFVASIQNYILNHKWSFGQSSRHEPLSVRKGAVLRCGASLG